jgi:CheY-like chemotaxis protein
MIEINTNTSGDSFFLDLLLTTLDSLFNNIVALLSTEEHESSIQIRKQVTTDLRRLSNIAKKSTENRMLTMYLEKGMKHIDNLISDYQRPIDPSEVKYPGPNLLLIEDEPYFIQEIIEALQENLHANVIVTTNADEATNILLSDQLIDLVIADLMIPMKDRLSTEPYQGGIDVCLKAKETRGADLPIVCLTVVSDAKILKKLRKIGVNLIINKPAISSEVVDAVRDILADVDLPVGVGDLVYDLHGFAWGILRLPIVGHVAVLGELREDPKKLV